jgi:hypothetical protein
MSEQIDQLGKLKARMEKDKMTVKMQLDDTKSAIEHVSHEKAGDCQIWRNFAIWDFLIAKNQLLED